MTRRIVATLLAASLVALGLSLVPAASAHNCRGENPGVTCGPCPDGEDHDHHYVDDSHYCYSESDPDPDPDPDPKPLPCDVEIRDVVCIILFPVKFLETKLRGAVGVNVGDLADAGVLA